MQRALHWDALTAHGAAIFDEEGAIDRLQARTAASVDGREGWEILPLYAVGLSRRCSWSL